MNQRHLGKLQPRYKFLLNPHDFLKYSSCPMCNKLTHPRKFPLFIHVTGANAPVVIGKTCNYCSKSELIICQQSNLDELLAKLYAQVNPQLIGNDYFVVGAVDMKAWKKSLTNPMSVEQTIEQLVDFKDHVRYDVDPGGWRHKDADPSKYIIPHSVAEARRQTSWTTGRTPQTQAPSQRNTIAHSLPQ